MTFFSFIINNSNIRSCATRKTSDSSHIALTSKYLPGKVQYRQSVNPSVDGNTVELAVEQMEFAENAIRYQTTLDFINSKVKGLMGAIRGE